MPIFVYGCDCGHRFERLVPRDAQAPSCPKCSTGTRKLPAMPSLARGAASPSTPGDRNGSALPIPWRGVAAGGPEKLQREVGFRQQLEAKAHGGLRTPNGPEPSMRTSGGSSG